MSADTKLWDVYNNVLKKAKYVDLTHAFSPTIPVWPGFGNAIFKPGVAGQEIKDYCTIGEPFQIKKHGFISSSYVLVTDQYGTQLDPPAHFYEFGATISDLPATYSIRPLVVIDIHEKVEKDPGYHATIEDINAWEAKFGKIPEGSVVAIRSDWYKKRFLSPLDQHINMALEWLWWRWDRPLKGVSDQDNLLNSMGLLNKSG
jgi:kynurenine formamidase